ncbi:MAG: M48 family metallopeptidase [Clostridia bacterium]|nr:M48 family metallopeptidase [Clostridia bacterium]
MYLTYENETVEYEIKYSNRQSIALQLLGPYKLLLKGPKVKDEIFEKAMKDQWQWIITHSEKYKDTNTKEPRAYITGDTFKILEKTYTIRVNSHQMKRAEITVLDHEILFFVPENFSLEGYHQLMENLLKKMLHRYLKERIAYYQPFFKNKVNHISVRNQKTRWGSCSSAGNINFNYRLALAPFEVIDYIIVHEMSHLEHMNHSKSYWKKVHQVMPEYKKHETWLKHHGRTLTVVKV